MIGRVAFPRRDIREKVVHLVTMAYDTQEFEHLTDAAKLVTDFYKMPPVKRFVKRRKEFTPRTVYAKCWQNGWIEILSPAVWKEPRDLWVATVLHELAHYIFWVDDEKRADEFAARWVA